MSQKLVLAATMVALFFGAVFASPIKLGKSFVSLSFEPSDSIDLQTVTPSVIISSIFDEPLSGKTIPMQRTADNSWAVDIPMEMEQSIAALRIDESKDSCLGLELLYLTQGDTIEIKGFQKPDGKMGYHIASADLRNKRWESDSTSTENNMATRLSRIAADMSWLTCDLHPQKSDFSDYGKLNEKFEGIFYEKYMKNGVHNLPASTRAWFVNNLRHGYAGTYQLSYKKFANAWHGIPYDSVPVYPDRYYTFLKDIDLSDDNFLVHIPGSFTPYYFCYQLLYRFKDDIQPAGESDCAAWKEKAQQRLSKLGMKVTPHFMDFLLASSYMMQLQDNRPLTDRQIENISNAFSDDLGAIVLEKDQELKQQLQQSFEYYDYSSEPEFSLTDFINSHYKDEAVVVDFWQTWCGPCLAAIEETKTLKHTVGGSGIAFLYVSDDTSPLKEYENLSRRIGGVHIRLSNAAMEGLMDKYGFTAFPTYLFISKDHNSVRTETGFPGIQEFEREVNALK